METLSDRAPLAEALTFELLLPTADSVEIPSTSYASLYGALLEVVTQAHDVNRLSWRDEYVYRMVSGPQRA